MDYCFTLYVVANNYWRLGQNDQALNLFNHSIAMGDRYGFYNNLSDTYISLIDIHSELGQFEQAADILTWSDAQSSGKIRLCY